MAVDGRITVFDVTADIGLRIVSPTLAGVYDLAGRGLFSLITDRRRIREQESVRVEVPGDDPDDLLFNWLNELIFRFEVERWVFRRFAPVKMTAGGLEAVGRGERFDPARHPAGMEVKAATYHRLAVEARGNIWVATVILDL